jgi:hypothetical protein
MTRRVAGLATEKSSATAAALNSANSVTPGRSGGVPERGGIPHAGSR